MVSGNIGVGSSKFKILSLNEIPEFPFWRLSICVGFDFNEIKKKENVKKLNKTISRDKKFVFTKLPNPIRETRVLKLFFIAIPCLKFWVPRHFVTSFKARTSYRC